MLLIVGTIRLPPAKLMEARAAMMAMLNSSRAEDGCIEYNYAEDIADPGLIRVTELWRDRDALDRHFASTHLAGWRASWSVLGIGDRELKLYEVGEPIES